MRYTVRNATQVVAAAYSFTRYDANQCLNYSWHCTDYPNSAGIANAADAWRASKGKHTDRNPPPGALAYFSVSSHRFGHVAPVVKRGGILRSTDWPERYHVGDVSISQLEKAWGATYLGWTDCYITVPIAGLQSAVTSSHPTLTGAQVKSLQTQLLRVFPAYAGRIRNPGGGPNTHYGPNTVAVVKEFQKRAGVSPANGQWTDATRKALAKFGVKV